MGQEVINSMEFSRAVDHYLASLIQRRDYAAAVQYYEDNLDELKKDGGIIVGSVFRHAATAYSFLSDYRKALKTARMAQNFIVKEGDCILLAEVFLTLGEILRNMDKLKEAETAFRDAESIFRRQDCQEGQCRALNQLAGLFYRKADFKNALVLLLDAIDIVRKLKDDQKLAYMTGNVGRIYTFTGDFAKAEDYLQVNIDLSTKLNDWKEVARANLALGYVFLQQDKFQQAEQSLEQASMHLDVLNDQRDKVIYRSYLGELYYRTGRLQSAAETLQKALELAEKIAPRSTLVGRVMRHLAELQVRLKNYSTAGHFAARAMVIMKSADNMVEMGALWKIKAIVSEMTGDKVKAKEFYSKAIDILQESGVRFEKADALLTAGRSELFNPRKRLTYLFRAEQFYRDNGLSEKFQKVERIINSISFSSNINTSVKSGRLNKTGHQVDFLTNCEQIKQFKTQLPVISRSGLPLLLTGETGVGKDHMARYYHSLVRHGSPFMGVNCASLPETLLESELFGYQKGAFTGALTDKPGLFVAANSGVMFLDEIGDLPLTLQAKLLGVIESGRILPLGSTREIQLDLKLVVATNRDLDMMVENGDFRKDLYYRLGGINFRIPPLRHRKEDIPLLLQHFINNSNLQKDNGKIPSEIIQQFVDYDWPGNTRELYNKIKKLEVMVELVSEGDLVELSRTMFSSHSPMFKGSLFDRVEQFERKIIIEAILAAQGNKSQAARILGVHEATIRAKLKRYQVRLEGGVIH